ncbi:MAG: DUF58 domain-containing protein [Pseudomonadota bacterium]
MSQPLRLRQGAEALAEPFPPLLAAAEHLAASVLLGEHGRRRAGMGDEFWQYRASMPGDERRMVDWRRSARSDAQFVREKEWQAAQSVMIWVDPAKSMGFSSSDKLSPKGEVARTLALAAAVLLIRAGERVGLTSLVAPPRSGQLQLLRLATALSEDSDDEYGRPELRGILHHARAIFVSDFLGDLAPVETALTKAADRDVKGAILHVLDPAEEAFPFDGRTIFESMGGSISHETLKAGDLRDRYLNRLAKRKGRLKDLAQATGWQYHLHHTDQPGTGALLWLHGALGRVH